MRDLIRRPLIHQAGGQTVGDPETSLHLPQRQCAAVRRQQPAIELGHHGLAGDKSASGNIGPIMAGVAR